MTVSPSDRRRDRPAARPLLFVSLDLDRPLEGPLATELAGAAEVVVGRGAARTAERVGAQVAVRVPDSHVSTRHARLTREHGRWMIEDAGSKNGTLVNGMPVARRTVLVDGDVVEVGRTLMVFREVAGEPEGPTPGGLPGYDTAHPPLIEDLAALSRVIPSRLPVLVEGESGTGKELIARAVHELAARPGPFVAINCGALPRTLVESELFGHRKGAFSGADEDRPGLVRSADRGTLFLDEIGDLPPESQAAFLRVLQEGEVTPVGATRPVAVDVRVVAATHRDLAALLTSGEFRRDLHARLNGFSLWLPPLRERREDIGLLIGNLVRRVAPDRAHSITFAPAAGRSLLCHDWPGNVRELERVLARAVLLAADGRILGEHLPAEVAAAPASPATSPAPRSEEEADRRAALVELLREHAGNVSAVARAMGKSRTQIQRWIKRYQLGPRSWRG